MASNCVGNVRSLSVKAEFKWEIQNFCISGKDFGDFLESPKFVASNIDSNVQWYLRLFPRGETIEAEDNMSLYLYASTKIKAMGHFRILTNKGKVVANKTTKELIYDENGSGFLHFLSRDIVLNSDNDMSNDENIVITCELIVMDSIKVKKNQAKKKRKLENQDDDLLPQFKIIKKYEKLFNDRESKFTDVTLESEGKTVMAHKCILANSSSVFAAMFNSTMISRAKVRQAITLDFNNIRYEVLFEMIRFIYTGRVNNIDTLASELVGAADKYGLYELKDMCEKILLKNLSCKNVISHIPFAKKFGMNKLSEKAIEFIVENAIDITEKSEFKSLEPDILYKVCYLLAKKGK